MPRSHLHITAHPVRTHHCCHYGGRAFVGAFHHLKIPTSTQCNITPSDQHSLLPWQRKNTKILTYGHAIRSDYCGFWDKRLPIWRCMIFKNFFLAPEPTSFKGVLPPWIPVVGYHTIKFPPLKTAWWLHWEPCKRIFMKLSVMWLSCGSYGVFVAVMVSRFRSFLWKSPCVLLTGKDVMYRKVWPWPGGVLQSSFFWFWVRYLSSGGTNLSNAFKEVVLSMTMYSLLYRPCSADLIDRS